MAFLFPSLLLSCIHLSPLCCSFCRNVMWQLQVSFLPHSFLSATMLLLLSLFAATQETHPSCASESRPSDLFIVSSILLLLLNDDFLLLCWAFVFIALHSIIFLLSIVFSSLVSAVFITSSLLALVVLSLALCCGSSGFLDTRFLGSGGCRRGGRKFLDLVFDGAEGGCFAQGGSCYLVTLLVMHKR